MFNVDIKRATGDANHGLTTRYEGSEKTRKHSSQATASGRKFVSKYPFFMVVISPHCLKHHCVQHIPAGFAKEHIKKHDICSTVETADGSWAVKLINSGGRFTFSAGWAVFARENSLQQGDVCAGNLMKMINTFGNDQKNRIFEFRF